ncbi:flavodoxin family protein [uncultured Anaerofustis sp.]|uniref:flavodoxin family protein n=1 Tax=uncultured Anaerofustis sp. TaxID=904996 RepID=UPI0025E958E3|nr:flavodoxin family protein [uncultured Anaerofustis sp.]
MKFLILMGSPRKNGNTISLVKPFIDEIRRSGDETDIIWLYDKDIKGCIACRHCQKDWSKFGCIHKDDMQFIFDKILLCDKIILATPIYSWSCPSPMKAMLDRLVYGMNKYYGDRKGPSLWKGKSVSIITTCGYDPQKGADLFEESIKRYCKHSKLIYEGMLAELDLGYSEVFISDDKIERARSFAKKLLD